MNVQLRHHVRVLGDGATTMVFAHGLGCDQAMWRKMTPAFEADHRVVLFDLAGCGNADPAAWRPDRHGTLHGYADDLLELLADVSDRPVIYLGHSVSGMIGLLASLRQPERFESLLMMNPSPCYVNHTGYHGGFSSEEIDGLLETIDSNYLGWASSMAPTLMGAPSQPELGVELEQSFHRTDPTLAKAFARTTFLSDHRDDIVRCTVPALILQCSEDAVVPLAVGEHMHAAIAGSHYKVIDNVGHYPHLSAPDASVAAIREYLSARTARE